MPASEHSSNGFVYSVSGAASKSVTPGSKTQYNNYSSVGFTINQTLQPNTEYYLYFLGTMDGSPCYINLTSSGTSERGISITLTN